jgi:anthranilate synthase
LFPRTETELKASALIDSIVRDDFASPVFSYQSKDKLSKDRSDASQSEEVRRVLLVDHEDSFVHTLANYIRQSGAEVVTCRSGQNFNQFLIDKVQTGSFVLDLAVLSPGASHLISSLVNQ